MRRRFLALQDVATPAWFRTNGCFPSCPCLCQASEKEDQFDKLQDLQKKGLKKRLCQNWELYPWPILLELGQEETKWRMVSCRRFQTL